MKQQTTQRAVWHRTTFNDFKPLPPELQAVKDHLLARPRSTNHQRSVTIADYPTK